MDVTLYVNTSDKYNIHKSISSVGSYSNVVIKDPTDTVHPHITIQTSSNLSAVNYMYIPRYGRYYFVEKPISVNNGVWELQGTSDPLMSFQSAVLSVSGTLTRSETLFNAYLNDSAYNSLAYRKTVTKAFPNEMDDDTFILVTIG